MHGDLDAFTAVRARTADGGLHPAWISRAFEAVVNPLRTIDDRIRFCCHWSPALSNAADASP